MFTHEKLIVYQRAQQWLAISIRILSELPTGNGEIANQLKRAALSIPLNIAEGAGRVSRIDKQRYFAIARGSALECAAILDALSAMQVAQQKDIAAARILLYEIVSMLSTLCRK